MEAEPQRKALEQPEGHECEHLTKTNQQTYCAQTLGEGKMSAELL
jgi:hypothetical protein